MSSVLIRAIALFCFWPLLVSAKNTTGKPNVEIKCLVPEENISAVSRKVGLQSRKPTRRVVCFFDTDSLSLFHHRPKLVLRSRYDSASDSDTTVKVRNGEVTGGDVECEFDKVIGKEKVMSCSLTDKEQGTAEVKRANRGKKVKKIFSKEQRAMIEKTIGKLEWEKVRPYGPVKSVKVWKKIKVSNDLDLTIERWELPARAGKPRRTLFEVSAKVPLEREAEASRWIADLVASPKNGDQESETKTRIVLEHFRSEEER